MQTARRKTNEYAMRMHGPPETTLSYADEPAFDLVTEHDVTVMTNKCFECGKCYAMFRLVWRKRNTLTKHYCISILRPVSEDFH